MVSFCRRWIDTVHPRLRGTLVKGLGQDHNQLACDGWCKYLCRLKIREPRFLSILVGQSCSRLAWRISLAQSAHWCQSTKNLAAKENQFAYLFIISIGVGNDVWQRAIWL